MRFLYLFDIDGTLIRSFMREGARDRYDDVEVLPGRFEKLRRLAAMGHQMALVTNQGGVAFGYQSESQVLMKLGAVCEAMGFVAHEEVRKSYHDAWAHRYVVCFSRERRGRVASPPHAYVSLGHPKATARKYLVPETDDWRKPGGGMILQAMADYGADRGHTIFVGDMETDEQAAKAAGVTYLDAGVFFPVSVGAVVGSCGADLCSGAVVVEEVGEGRRPDVGVCDRCGTEYGVPKAPVDEGEPVTAPKDDIPF